MPFSATRCGTMKAWQRLRPYILTLPKNHVGKPVAKKPAKKGKGRKQAEPVIMEMPALTPIPPKPVTNSKDGRKLAGNQQGNGY